MLLSANMIRFYNDFGIKKTFDIFSNAEIQGIDFNLDVKDFLSNKYDKEFFIDIKKYAKEKGVAICQAHAPFPPSYVEEEKSRIRFMEIVEAIKNASILGAPMIVVHPCNHLDCKVDNNEEILFDYNVKFYKKLEPYAKEYGVKIAIENIFDTITGTADKLNKLYDALNSEVFTICFDVGHSFVEGCIPAEEIKKLGYRLVDGCTHVHDNSGDKDSHTLPFYGKIDWETVMEALASIGYQGDFNYEASGFIKDIPVSLREEGLKYMAKIGHYLIGRFEYYKTLNKKD